MNRRGAPNTLARGPAKPSIGPKGPIRAVKGPEVSCVMAHCAPSHSRRRKCWAGTAAGRAAGNWIVYTQWIVVTDGGVRPQGLRP